MTSDQVAESQPGIEPFLEHQKYSMRIGIFLREKMVAPNELCKKITSEIVFDMMKDL